MRLLTTTIALLLTMTVLGQQRVLTDSITTGKEPTIYFKVEKRTVDTTAQFSATESELLQAIEMRRTSAKFLEASLKNQIKYYNDSLKSETAKQYASEQIYQQDNQYGQLLQELQVFSTALIELKKIKK